MDEPTFDEKVPRPKTPISKKTLKKIDEHYDGALQQWKKRYKKELDDHRSNRNHFNIAVTQLFETYENGHKDALPFLDNLMSCRSSSKCWQIFCPACRLRRQQDVAEKVLDRFKTDDASKIRFMTLLIKVEKDASKLPNLMDEFRKRLKNTLRNNTKTLGHNLTPLKVIGAFEIDLKNAGTQWDASIASRDLLKTLGFDPKYKPSQYLLHLHAIVGPLDDPRKDAMKGLIERSIEKTLLPHQLHFDTLHRNKSKEQNLKRLAHYMYKARLQFADNVFENNVMEKRTKYHTPYTGRLLVEYLKVVDGMQNFKGLKFEFGK